MITAGIAALIIPVFVAGLLTFLAPCTLPLVPAYLGFISGVSTKELQDPRRVGEAKRKIFLNGLFFIIGFSIIFILMGSLAGFLGTQLAGYRLWLSRIGGVLVILFGLFLLNIIRIPALTAERHFKIPFLKPGQSFNSLLLGAAFAFGWTPCVGPILGTVLTLTAAQATVGQGAVLLAVFSAGLAVPFLAVAWGFSSASRWIAAAGPYLRILSFIAGLLLLFFGVLLLTNRFGLMITYGYRLLQFINYEALLNYL